MLKKSVAARKDMANANMVLETFIRARYGPLYSINDPEAISVFASYRSKGSTPTAMGIQSRNAAAASAILM
jgi:hypothetical protein